MTGVVCQGAFGGPDCDSSLVLVVWDSIVLRVRVAVEVV